MRNGSEVMRGSGVQPCLFLLKVPRYFRHMLSIIISRSLAINYSENRSFLILDRAEATILRKVKVILSGYLISTESHKTLIGAYNFPPPL